MKTNELQKLLNECARIELDNDLGGNFGTDLKVAQQELDALKILNIPDVSNNEVAVCDNCTNALHDKEIEDGYCWYCGTPYSQTDC